MSQGRRGRRVWFPARPRHFPPPCSPPRPWCPARRASGACCSGPRRLPGSRASAWGGPGCSFASSCPTSEVRAGPAAAPCMGILCRWGGGVACHAWCLPLGGRFGARPVPPVAAPPSPCTCSVHPARRWPLTTRRPRRFSWGGEGEPAPHFGLVASNSELQGACNAAWPSVAQHERQGAGHGPRRAVEGHCGPGPSA